MKCCSFCFVLFRGEILKLIVINFLFRCKILKLICYLNFLSLVFWYNFPFFKYCYKSSFPHILDFKLIILLLKLTRKENQNWLVRVWVTFGKGGLQLLKSISKYMGYSHNDRFYTFQMSLVPFGFGLWIYSLLEGVF